MELYILLDDVETIESETPCFAKEKLSAPNKKRKKKEYSRERNDKTPPTKTPIDDTRVDIDFICSLVGKSKSTIYKWISERRFPQASIRQPRYSRWRYGDVIKHIDDQSEKSNPIE